MATPDELFAFEEQFEAAAAKLLVNAGFKVGSPFVRVLGTDAAGRPELEPIADDVCIVGFETGETDESILVFHQDGGGGISSMAGGWSGVLEITHRVPVGDEPPAPGQTPDCYKRLCRQRGRIRALFSCGVAQLNAELVWLDILSLNFIQPARRVDQQKLAHEATERLGIRFLSRENIS